MASSKTSKTPKTKKAPKPRFVTFGKGKYVHVVHTELYDRKNSQCQEVRKRTVAGKVPAGSMSPEAALALDGCERCGTHEVAERARKESMTPEQRRAESDDRRNETLDKAKTKTKKEQKAKTKAKSDKPAKATKSGSRSTGGSTEDKANALAAFAKEHGWGVTLDDGEPGIRLVAKRGSETIVCTFVDGKYDTSRHAYVKVGSWTGKLRGVHGCRNQMANEGRDRPHPNPGAGRSRAKSNGKGKEQEADIIPEDESPEDAARRVPFLMDDPDIDIIDAIKGKTIRWRNGVTNGVVEARVPSKSKRTVITAHPKTGRRILSFLEVVDNDGGHEFMGAERSVALDKIIRVIG